MFGITINVIPPEPILTPEEKKVQLVAQAHELIQQLYQLNARPSLSLINLRWSTNTASNIDEYIIKLSTAIVEGNAQITAIKEAKKQAELTELRAKASLLTAEAKQIRNSVSIADESQMELLNLRLELEAAIRDADPQPAVIAEKIAALSAFIHLRALTDDNVPASPELNRGRRLSK